MENRLGRKSVWKILFNQAPMKIAVLYSLGVLAVAPAVNAGISQGKPNIIVYIADDQSQADVSVYGAPVLRTPVAEALCAAGIRFNNAFVASPACAPSRAALLTGLMPSRNGAEANHTYPKPGIPLLIRKLQEAGYLVLGFGKVAHEKMNRECGFDFYGEQRVNFSKTISDYLKNDPPSRPVCLMIGDRRPHVPWTSELLYNPETVELPSYLIDTRETRNHWAAYYSDITGFDEEMGKVYQLVKQKFGDNYIWVYTADNGRQWPFGKWNLYETGIRVPLVMVWPGHIKPGTVTDALVSWVDIMPTLLDLAACKVPSGLDGKSFRKVLERKSNKHRDYIFTTHSGDVNMNVYPIRSVRSERYKYILNLRPDCYHSNHSDILRKPGAGAYWDSWDEAAKTSPRATAVIERYYIRPAEEFYDLRNDPDEQKNLISDKAYLHQIQKMKESLVQWMKDQNDSGKTFQEPYPVTGPKPHDIGIK
jgi:arylsulfatase A-like enzyme